METSILDSIEDKIDKWNENNKEFLSQVDNAKIKLSEILKIKNNLNKLIGKQNDDDLKFYESIINNSYTFLGKSLQVRLRKALYDYNEIYKLIDNKKGFEILNITNFTSMMNDFSKLCGDVKSAMENNTKLTWVKDDRIESIQQIISETDDAITYHDKLIDHFNNLLDLEKMFFCGGL